MKSQQKKRLFFDDSEMNYGLYKNKPVMPADSPEVLYAHYCDRIKILLTQLSKLTLLDHPCEIQSLCTRIILKRKKLKTLTDKYKIQQHSLQPGHTV